MPFLCVIFSDLLSAAENLKKNDEFNQMERGEEKQNKSAMGEINHAIKQLRTNQCL